jgi:hypothetical protein
MRLIVQETILINPLIITKLLALLITPFILL